MLYGLLNSTSHVDCTIPHCRTYQANGKRSDEVTQLIYKVKTKIRIYVTMQINPKSSQTIRAR